MARACKFCHFLNSFICDDFADCIDCGKCQPKDEPKKTEFKSQNQKETSP